MDSTRSPGSPPEAYAISTEVINLRPLIIAHRGASGYEPENTLRAFELAIRQRADMIELDLHATRDGEVVVIHDDDLTVTTDLKGRVSSMTRAQVLCADAGDGERVPTLRETLDLARGRIQLYLEIKDAKAATGTVQLVREFQVEDEVLLASFDLELMRRVQAENRDLKIGLILGTETFGTLVRLREHFLWIALRGYQYQVLSLHLDLCRRKTITKAHESGKTAFAWTANDETTIRRLIDLGVDGIVTNYPDRMAGMVFRDSG